jgi:hypothetical protein
MASRRIKERLLADLGMPNIEIEVDDYLNVEAVPSDSVDEGK